MAGLSSAADGAASATNDNVSSQASSNVGGNTNSKAGSKVTSLAARRQALNALLNEQWEYHLRHNPEFASMLGDKRYNDKLSDFSQAAIDAEHQADANFFKRFQAISAQGFSVQENLNRELMLRQLEEKLSGIRFKQWQIDRKSVV